VLDLRAAGLSRKEVAARLGIEESTVKNHLTEIYAKLEVGTLVDALRAVGRLE